MLSLAGTEDSRPRRYSDVCEREGARCFAVDICESVLAGKGSCDEDLSRVTQHIRIGRQGREIS